MAGTGRVAVPGIRELLCGIRDAVDPIPDVRGSAEWKSRVLERVVIDAVEEAVAERMLPNE